MFFLKVRPKKKKQDKLDEDKVVELIRNELSGYKTEEEIRAILSDISNDEQKKQVWNNLSPHKKYRLIKYLAGRRILDGKGKK